MNPKPAFDVLTTNCVELQKLLTAGTITSVGIVEAFLSQIERHNVNGLKLNAMTTTTPKDLLLSIAKQRDWERQQGNIRGPLHGIPITVKDNIMTGPEFEMPTTVGSAALRSAVARKNAPIVDMLTAAGAIVIGKANLSEMAGWKDAGLMTGWSAVGGQTQSPYIVGGVKPDERPLGHTTPGGSASGSAHGVAAGFAPLALATESDGSIVQPANRAALYGLKATVGLIPTEGTSPWSSFTDSIGGMARTPADIAILMSILTKTDFSSSLTESWEGQRVGFVDPQFWNFAYFNCEPEPILIHQQIRALEDARDAIHLNGGVVKQPLDHDFEREWNVFLKGYQDINIHSLADIVEFNKQHRDEALPPSKCSHYKNRVGIYNNVVYAGHPDQDRLEWCLNSGMSEQEYTEGAKMIRETARVNGIDRVLAAYNLDVIMGPMDSNIHTVAAAAGCPVGTMPLGYSSINGRPFGVCIISRAGGEASILKAMSAWHATMPARQPPPQLVNWC
ncbi:hypothetical protein N7528_005383 [Penicillium herquei]|nr:hypothetical protein N7528_005383 [Penicillium herquei]